MSRGEVWDLDQMPDQTGRRVVVTGATGGLGENAALEFARRGADVVLAGRNRDKLDAVADDIRAEVPDAALDSLVVDFTDLAAVRKAATDAARFGTIDVLLNNAGIMASPYRRTVDGLEEQLATNHFGPFLFTGLLLPQLARSEAARVVAVASNAHKMAPRPPLGDPYTKTRRHSRWLVYGQTKLANLLFTFEFDRRLRAAGLPVEALAAHPGYAATHLIATGQTGRASGGLASLFNLAGRLTGQPAAAGALPLLMAATADLPSGTYVGPSGPGEWRGRPHVVTADRAAYDTDAQRALWELSEQVTGISYP